MITTNKYSARPRVNLYASLTRNGVIENSAGAPSAEN